MLRVVTVLDHPATPVSVHSQVLGPVAVEGDEVLDFLEPLAGFPLCRRYAILPYQQRGGREDASIRWLQALQPPFHTFVIADPWNLAPDYAPEISDLDAADLEVWSFDEAKIYGIVTVAPSMNEITINLRAPIVVNLARRTGKQVVLLNGEYHTCHPVAPGAALTG